MDTPDKIYLNFPKIQPELDSATWDTKKWDDCENVEYLSKDYLMDEVNKLSSSAGANVNSPTYHEWDRGYKFALQLIKDIIQR